MTFTEHVHAPQMIKPFQFGLSFSLVPPLVENISFAQNLTSQNCARDFQSLFLKGPWTGYSTLTYSLRKLEQNIPAVPRPRVA